MKITHVVLKNNDVEKLSMEKQANLSEVQELVMRNRLAEGKRGVPKYFVINTDEPYAEEIIEVLKRNGHWEGSEKRIPSFDEMYRNNKELGHDKATLLALGYSITKVLEMSAEDAEAEIQAVADSQ